MSYASDSGRANNPAFLQRVEAACVKEAATMAGAGSAPPPSLQLAEAILADSSQTHYMRYLIAGAPVAGDMDTDDLVMLSAVQWAWPLHANARYPQAVPEGTS